MLQTRGILVNVKCHARMDGYHDGVRHTITRELLGRLGGSAKVQAMLGSMGLRYAGSDVPGWRITMMELVIPGRIPMGTRWCLIGKNLVWRYE